MLIYKQSKRFNQYTGEPYFVKKVRELRCDFSGVVMFSHDKDWDGEEQTSYPKYSFDYEDADDMYGSLQDEYDFAKKHNISSIREFMSQAYDFADGECMKMINSYINFDPDFPYVVTDFASMCRESRIATADKLIADGIITADSLCEK